jgi:uncharacterized protein (DUF4213/DUF364 family)
LKETVEEVRQVLAESLEDITLERVVVGLFFIGVKLSNGQGGMCYTPVKMIPEAVCCPSSAQAMPQSGKLKGRKAAEILEDLFSPRPLKKAIAIAVLNGLSEICRQKKRDDAYQYILTADPIDYLTIPQDAYAVVVGALVPYFKLFKANKQAFGILELDVRTLKADELPFYIEPEKADEAIAKADLLIITGTTLLNDTLEGLLAKRKPGAKVIVVGPTVSMLPDAFFKRGVVGLGGVTVTSADDLLNIIAEAGSGYHFYGKSAEKSAILNHPADNRL